MTVIFLFNLVARMIWDIKKSVYICMFWSCGHNDDLRLHWDHANLGSDLTLQVILACVWLYNNYCITILLQYSIFTLDTCSFIALFVYCFGFFFFLFLFSKVHTGLVPVSCFVNSLKKYNIVFIFWTLTFLTAHFFTLKKLEICGIFFKLYFHI